MSTTATYTDKFPRLILDTLLKQLKENLGDEIEFTINGKNVIFTKIPAIHKDNIFETIANNEFSPSLI